MLPEAFVYEEVAKDLRGSDVGDAFERFVQQVYDPSYLNLQRFKPGKDGGIDLLNLDDNGYIVWQCKHVGDGRPEADWAEVEKNLHRNLTQGTQPPTGQPQYGPWFEKDQPIIEFNFVISCVWPSPQRSLALQKRICLFFRELALHPHLGHLKDIVVNVTGWDSLERSLRRMPHLLFRWFPAYRLSGFAELASEPLSRGFRSFLYSDQLPYFSLADWAEIEPPPKPYVRTEPELVEALNEHPGIVIYGPGGVGKSRLSLQLGYEAQRVGWSVFRIVSDAWTESIESLVALADPGLRILVLVDYIETRNDFARLVARLDELTEKSQVLIRFVANCRTSYYYSVAEAEASSQHIAVNFSPRDAAGKWFAAYRQRIIVHIATQFSLQESAIQDSASLPVLAAFFAYLKLTNRVEQFRELLEARDFALWVATRLRHSLGDRFDERSLVAITLALPLPQAAHAYLTKSELELLDRLAQDGWIERRDDGFEAAQDVLADAIVKRHLDSRGASFHPLIQGLIARAAEHGYLASVLIAAQRLADHPVIIATPWYSLLEPWFAQIDAGCKLTVLRFPLLSAPEQLRLLLRFADMAEELIALPLYQDHIVTLCRLVSEGRNPDMTAQEKTTFSSIVCAVVEAAPDKNLLFRWGLRIFPKILRDQGLAWASASVDQRRTQYTLNALLKVGPAEWHGSNLALDWLGLHAASGVASHTLHAWLDNGHDPTLVRDAVDRWISVEANRLSPNAQFVLKAWLDHGHDPTLVGAAVGQWLSVEANRLSAVAQFVLKAWLDHGHDPTLVKDAVGQWLSVEANRLSAVAQFVLRAWLDNGNDTTLVRDKAAQWLHLYDEADDIDYLLRAWFTAGLSVDDVRKPISVWLANHASDPEASFLIKSLTWKRVVEHELLAPILQWVSANAGDEYALVRLRDIGNSLQQQAVFQPALHACEMVMKNDIALRRFDDRRRSQYKSVMHHLMCNPEFGEGASSERGYRLFGAWLLIIGAPSDNRGPWDARWLGQMVEHIKQGLLNPEDPRHDEALLHHVKWLDSWPNEMKARLASNLAYAKEKLPTLSRYWDKIHVDEPEVGPPAEMR